MRRSNRNNNNNAPPLAPPPEPNPVVEAAERRRAAYRAAIVRIVQSVAQDAALMALTREQIEAKMQHLARQWHLIDAPQQEIVALTADAAQIAVNEAYIVDVEELYLACEARLRARLHALEPAVAIPGVQKPREFVIRHRREPKVPQFNGRHENWAPFFDMFRVEVHERDDLEPLEKFTLLKTACVGLAANVLGDWQHTAANYPLAWAELQRTYDDRYAAKARLIAKIFKMPRQTDESHDGLRSLMSIPRMALQQLQAFGEPTDQWDLIIVQIILFRLPTKVAEQFERERRRDIEPTLAALYAWLEARARSCMIVEAADRVKREQREQRDQKKQIANNGQPRGGLQQNQKAAHEDNGQPRAAARDGQDNKQGQRDRNNRNNTQKTSNNRGPSNRPMVCWICKDEHSMYDCPRMLAMNAEQRKNEMTKNGVCTQCGRRHPHAPICTAPKECGLCNNAKHIDMICPKKVRQDAEQHNVQNARKRSAFSQQ